MKKAIKTTLLCFTLVTLLVQYPSFSMFGKGKWMNVYNGGSTPQYKECVSAIASKCVVGDSRGVIQEAQK